MVLSGSLVMLMQKIDYHWTWNERIAFVELSLQESIRDAHSSLAVLIKNPAWS